MTFSRQNHVFRCGITMSFCILVLFFAIFRFGYSSALKRGEICLTSKSCDAGLHCETCLANGNVKPRCTRIQPIIPLSKVKGLPFNSYTWLTAHNAFSRLGVRSATGSIILSPQNQQDSITEQLNEPSSVEKIMEIDEHIGCAMSGLIADARTLVEHARVETQNHRFSYGEPMTVESTTQALCDLALRFGEGDEESMSRPFGVSLLIAGHDENGTSLKPYS